MAMSKIIDADAYFGRELKVYKDKTVPFIQEMGQRQTSMGQALYIKVLTSDYRQLSWSEVWQAFSDSYPGQWAVQMFPPASELVDEQNIYHLFVLEDEPRNLSIKR